MAENVVEIVVRSKNDTKAGFAEAVAEADVAGKAVQDAFNKHQLAPWLRGEAETGGEEAGDIAGQGFMAKFGSWLTGGQSKGVGESGGGISGLLKAAFSTPQGAAAVAAAASSLAIEFVGVLSGVVAAGAGIGSFALLALPTLDKIKNAYTAISTAQTALNAAQAKENMAPSKTNETAVKNAELALKLAQQVSGTGIADAVSGVQQLVASFHQMATAIQPAVLTVFDQALGIANELLPTIGQFANAAAPAIEKVMTSLSKSINSKQFQDVIGQLVKVTPGAITAIASGIGQLFVALGKLLTLMSAKDDANAIKILFTTIYGLLMGLVYYLKFVMLTWDSFWSTLKATAKAGEDGIAHTLTFLTGFFLAAFSAIKGALVRAMSDLANWAQDVDNAVTSVQNWFRALPGKIVSALGSLAGDLYNAGLNAIRRLAAGITAGAGSVLSAIGGVVGIIASHLPKSPAQMGPLSGSGDPLLSGRRIAERLSAGMRSGAANVASASAYMTGAVAGGMAGGAGGTHITLSLDSSFQQLGLSAAALKQIRYTVRTLGGGSAQQAFGRNNAG